VRILSALIHELGDKNVEFFILDQ